MQSNQGFYYNGGNLVTINNTGTFRKSAGTGIILISGNIVFTNTSATDVQLGLLSIQGGGASTGSFTVASTTVLQFTGVNYTLDAGTSITGGGVARLSGASLTVASGVSVQNFELVGGTLTSAGTFTITDSFLWSGGAMAGR